MAKCMAGVGAGEFVFELGELDQDTPSKREIFTHADNLVSTSVL